MTDCHCSYLHCILHESIFKSARLCSMFQSTHAHYVETTWTHNNLNKLLFNRSNILSTHICFQVCSPSDERAGLLSALRLSPRSSSTDIPTCVECCSSPFCNLAGCGAEGILDSFNLLKQTCCLWRKLLPFAFKIVKHCFCLSCTFYYILTHQCIVFVECIL